MRVTKQKRHRRAVRFFTAVYGFRQPYKILCDGTFIHHLVANDITPADKALSSILGGPVKLYTTRCVLGELKRLGASYSESLDRAHLLLTARCDHEKMKGADACFVDVIGESNPGHFFAATQDADLRKKFREVPGVPLVFALRNALLLEPPSEFQHQFANKSEEKRLHMTEVERKMLKKKVESAPEDEEGEARDKKNDNSGSGSLSVQPPVEKRAKTKGLKVKDGPQFKRKRAKAPNPLSVKKKKTNPNPTSMKEKEAGKEEDAARKRKRKRSNNKAKKPAEAEG